MEDEARNVLRSALHRKPACPGCLAASIRARFVRVGWLDLPAIPRDPVREPPFFGT